MNTRKRKLPGGRAAPAALLLVALAATVVKAADHKEAPGSTADPAADIADVYAWHNQATNRLVAAITFAGLADSAVGPTYDDDVLYTLHIDNAPADSLDNVSDIQVLVRFGQNTLGAWGVKVENLPGASGPIVGPVDAILGGGGGTKVFAGPREDPFFFDLEGYRETLMTATLSFDSGRDTFAGLNVTAIVLEMDLQAALGGADRLQLWATTGRKQP